MFKKIKVEFFLIIVCLATILLSNIFNIKFNDYFSKFNVFSQNTFLIKFFVNITTLGNSVWYFAPSITLIIICYFIKNQQFLDKYRKIYNNIFYVGSLLFLSVLCSGIITQILKHIMGRPRPNANYLENGIGFSFFSFDSDFHSFPSGHATTIFAAVLVCSLIMPKIKYFLYILSGVVAFSRVVVGAHYITDVIGSIFVALIGFKISIIVLSKFTNFDQKKELLILINKNSVLALISFVVLVIFLTIGPTFDIFFSGLFYLDNKQFFNQEYYYITIFFRKIIIYFILIYILVLPILSIFLPIHKIYLGYKFNIKKIIFLWACTLFSLVIFINLIIKNFWGRARPNEILELDGEKLFTPWFYITNQCSTNCSFVSGDAAVGFSLIIFYFLIKKEIYLWFSLFFGLAIGLVRISEGGHYFSDIIFSYLIVFCITASAYLFYSKKIND